MKFLYIVDHFPPRGVQGGIRALFISKYLIKTYRTFPIILTRKVYENNILTKNFIKEIPDSLKVYRSMSLNLRYFFYFIDSYFIPNEYLNWIPFGYYYGKKILKKNRDIKFIYASAPGFHTHIIAYLLHKIYKLPFVIEYRDPLSFNPYKKPNKRKLNQILNWKLEKKILRSSTLIVTISPALKQFLLEKFPFLNNKIISIPNGLKKKKTNKNSKKEKKNKIRFVFTGNIYGKRDPTTLFRIMSELKKENFFHNLDFKFELYGKYDLNQVEKKIKNLNITKLVELNGSIHRSLAIRRIESCDIAVHIGENLNYPTLAFKVWDYLSCGKKILYLGQKNSYTANFLEENELGYTIPINDINKGKDIMKEIILKLKNNKIRNSLPLQKIEDFTWKERAKKFYFDIIQELKIRDTVISKK